MPAHSTLRHPRRTLLKASSFEVLRRVPSEYDEDVNDGSSTPPPRTMPRRPASSGILASQRQSSLAFQVGSNIDDDVFTEPTSNAVNIGSNESATNEDINEQASPEKNEEDQETQISRALVPHEPVPVDAQNIYPPSACVFAANLTQQHDDHKLEHEVTKYFSQFGTVFVKIRRDNRQMPFAFCQFTRDADAQKAEKYGQGAMILGRPCRVEMAKANASFIVYKSSGAATTEKEATDLLSALGEIAKAAPLEVRLQQSLSIPSAIVVQYKRYDPARDINRAFQKHEVFRVIPFDTKQQEIRPQRQRGNAEQQSLQQYERDRRSAFFGNLPLRMTEEMLSSIVSSCGSVVKAEVKRKFVPLAENETVEICFAFVEFARPDSIEDVILTFNQKEIEGNVVKVERKQSRSFVTPNRHGHEAPRGGYSSSSIHRRRAGGSFDLNPAGYRSNYASPHNGNQGMFPSSAGSYSRGYASPSAPYNSGGYHLPRQASRQFSRMPLAIAGPAPRESPVLQYAQMPPQHPVQVVEQPKEWKKAAAKAAIKVQDDDSDKTKKVPDEKTPGEEKPETQIKPTTEEKNKDSNSGVKVDAKVEAKADAKADTKADAKVDAKADAKADITDTPQVADPKLENTKREDKTPAKPSKGKEPLAYTENTPNTDRGDPASGGMYPMVPPYSPYGYPPMPSYMPGPLTPQGGPMMYNNYSGSYYPPAPYQDVFSMYPLYNPISLGPVDTPTRSAQGDEQKKTDAESSANKSDKSDKKKAKEKTQSKTEGEKKPESKGKERAN